MNPLEGNTTVSSENIGDIIEHANTSPSMLQTTMMLVGFISYIGFLLVIAA